MTEHETDVDLEQGRDSEDQRRAETPGSMLGAVAGNIGSGALQRKLQRRALQRRGAAGTSAEPMAGEGAQGAEALGSDGVYGGVHRSVRADDTSLVSDAAKPKDSEIAKLKKGELIQPVDLGAGQSFNQKTKGTGEQWWKVKVVKGDHKGKEGWVHAGGLDSIVDVKDKGKKNYDKKVAGGHVTIRTGEQVDGFGKPLDNVFSLEYEGKDASNAQWLQFIWREVIGVDAGGKSAPVAGDISTSGGTYQLTDGGTKDKPGTPGKQNYNTDSADKSHPFYEAGFAGDRTADSTAMFDQPYGATDKANDAFANGAKSVVSRAHFSTFLIKNKKVQFKTHVNINWTFSKPEETKAPPKGKHTVSDSGATTSLPKTIAERFHEQYPAYKDIK